MEVTLQPKKICIILAIAILAFVILSTLGHIYKFTIGHERYLVNLFDLDHECNFPTLFAAMSLFFCSVLLCIIAFAKKKEDDRFYLYWIFLSIIFFFLFIDEIIQLHEQSIAPLRSMLNASGIFYFTWVLPAIILTLILVLVFLKFLAKLPANIRLLFIISGSFYVAGAIGGEIIGGFYQSLYGISNLIYALITDLEEFLEMFGILIFTYALLSYISSDFKYLQIHVIDK